MDLQHNDIECKNEIASYTQSFHRQLTEVTRTDDEPYVWGSDLLVPRRQSLFLNTYQVTKQTSNTDPSATTTTNAHTRLYASSESDTDISEISELSADFLSAAYSSSEGSKCPQTHLEPTKSSAFYICNSPSPTTKTASYIPPEEPIPCSSVDLHYSRRKSLFECGSKSQIRGECDTDCGVQRQVLGRSATCENTMDLGSCSSTEISENELYCITPDDNHRRGPTFCELFFDTKPEDPKRVTQEDDWVSVISSTEKKPTKIEPNRLHGELHEKLPSVQRHHHTHHHHHHHHIFHHKHTHSNYATRVDCTQRKRNSSPAILKTKSLLSGMMISSEKGRSLSHQPLFAEDHTLQRSNTVETMRSPCKQLQNGSVFDRLDCFNFKSIRAPSHLDLCHMERKGTPSVKQTSSVALSDFNVIGRSSSLAVVGTNDGSTKPCHELASKSAMNLTRIYRSSVSRTSFQTDNDSQYSMSNFFFGRRKVECDNVHCNRSSICSSSLRDKRESFSVTSQNISAEPSDCKDNYTHTSFNPPNISTITSIIPQEKNPISPSFTSELSQSLRDSILKDHRLGKIPKPDRIVSGSVSVGIEIENDDYHAKGW